jgi:dsRNA-specific ribonuclease
MEHKVTPVSIEVTAIAETLRNCPEWLNKRPVFEGITIDAEESKDLDDAVWVSKTDEGWKVEVAISDVAQLIAPDGVLFEKIRGRQVSEYLSTGVRNMLPRILSEGHLSLNEKGEKPILLVTIELNHQLDVQNLKLNEARFRSLRRMSFMQVAQILNNNETNDTHYQLLAKALELSQNLMQKRRNRGALAFYDLKKGYITNENGQLVKIVKKETTIAYLIIQELMILTNTSIAKFFAKNEIPFIFRNHNMKAATPERDVLLDQYLVALNDANAFEMLNNRMQILANPAKYETVLNGHYGLNETAYAHLTSPIRRFADLVNHYQIKSFINKQLPIFSSEQLNIFCDEINTGNAYRRDTKNEFFLSKEKKRLAEKAGKMSFGNLIEIPVNEFRKILKAGATFGKMRPELEEACNWHMEQNHFTAIDFYLLLTMAKEERLSTELKTDLEKALLAVPGASSQMIQFMLKEGIFAFIDNDVEAAPSGGFMARYKGVFTASDTLISTQNYSWEQNKRDALNNAAYWWVMTYFNDSFVTADKTLQPAEALKPAAVQNLEDEALCKENYYGRLLELTHKEDTIKSGIETFTHEGTPHEPIFNYSIPLIINEIAFTFEAEGNTKKLAKQKAAKKALEYLLEINPDLFNCLSKKKKPVEHLLGSNNYPSILQVLLQQNTENSFKYEFEELDARNTENRYSTTICIQLKGEESSFSTTGPSKKEGKKVVAKMAIDQLFNL